MKKRIDFPIPAKIVLWSTAVFAFTILMLFVFKTNPLHSSYNIDTSIFANYGSIVGCIASGALSFVSIIMIIQSLNKQQAYYARIEVEQRVFEFVHLYRENVSQASGQNYHGRNMFIMIRNEIIETYDVVSDILKSDDDFKIPYRESATMAKIDISFLLVFFGLGEHTDDYLISSIGDYCEESKAKKILAKVGQIHQKIKKSNVTEKANGSLKYTYLPYWGHQSRLGHYFRHLYQAVNYINDLPDDMFTRKDKYDYVKMIRAQMSNHELAVFFFNSVSRMGRAWEISRDTEDKKLITKYNILKNIPAGFTGNIFPREFYPNIAYEEIDFK